MGNRKPYKQDYHLKRSFYSRDADFIKDIEARYKTDNPNDLPRRLKRSYQNAKAREAKRIANEVFNKLNNKQEPKQTWEFMDLQEYNKFKRFDITTLTIDALTANNKIDVQVSTSILDAYNRIVKAEPFHNTNNTTANTNAKKETKP